MSGRGFSVVSFLSDFGLDDIFVGVCHGVLARIAPHARVIDLTHGVAPGAVADGAALLARSVPYLPAAVQLAVVDPGVGTERRGLAVTTGRGDVLIGPDNGLLGEAAAALGGLVSVFELTAATHRLHPTSATFHGRDVFAPAAGAIADGVPPDGLGEEVAVDTLVRLPARRCHVTDRCVESEVVLVDRFGNVQLAADSHDLEQADLGSCDRLTVEVAVDRPPPGTAGGRSPTPQTSEARYVPTFGQLPSGQLGIYVDSDWHLALAVNGGSAASRLSLGPGDRVMLHAPLG